MLNLKQAEKLAELQNKLNTLNNKYKAKYQNKIASAIKDFMNPFKIFFQDKEIKEENPNPAIQSPKIYSYEVKIGNIKIRLEGIINNDFSSFVGLVWNDINGAKNNRIFKWDSDFDFYQIKDFSSKDIEQNIIHTTREINQLLKSMEDLENINIRFYFEEGNGKRRLKDINEIIHSEFNL